LFQNYPNPFNPSTNISYTIPTPFGKGSMQMGAEVFVQLKIYDVLGREIITLVNKEQPAGNYIVSFNAYHLPSGIYFYRLSAGSMVEVKKMMLLK
jgi:hypothetical protein